MSGARDSAKPEKGPRFWLIKSLPYAPRLALIVAFIFGGLILQLFMSQLGIGFALMLCGGLLAAVRGFDAGPKKRRGTTEWREVTEVEWERAIDLIKRGKRWRSDISNLGSGPGILVFVAVLVIAFVVFVVYVDEDDELWIVFVLDVLALFGPLYFAGFLSFKAPGNIEIKIKALRNVLDHYKELQVLDLAFQPLFEIRGRELKGGFVGCPEDARMMVSLRGAPRDFIGVQVQLAINSVQGTPYPYLYCVVIYKTELEVDSKKIGHPESRDVIFESSVDADNAILVIRQNTDTVSTGYHTNPRQQLKIVGVALEVARETVRLAVEK